MCHFNKSHWWAPNHIYMEARKMVRISIFCHHLLKFSNQLLAVDLIIVVNKNDIVHELLHIYWCEYDKRIWFEMTNELNGVERWMRISSVRTFRERVKIQQMKRNKQLKNIWSEKCELSCVERVRNALRAIHCEVCVVYSSQFKSN